MQLRGTHRLAALAGAAALVLTTMSGPASASARTTETLCGPEVELSAVVYQACSDVLSVEETQYGTMPYLYAKNRGIGSVSITVTIEHWNYATSAWVTDSTGPRTIGASSDTRYFGPSHLWSCGQNARERARATSTVGTGAWSEVVTPAPC
ncbi:hypothetical protein AGRA3207_003209 [Actinomadura graeca]|uniref:Secreted protein n=1 Tax=Actinomadura graeca TaxID=2750812 RepID=A0ABX8QW80_9ACTN|nr:hypothetical protein [Actinomadura graeca]QXJ22239.1 hypothetical protein AGRA3207_003209 [Actinomadura graeca]